MRVLITGNMGYVGAGVVRHLRQAIPQAVLHGFDQAYFAHCLTAPDEYPDRWLDRQTFGDVRAIDPTQLEGYDGIIHLAAVSNDPMGHRFEQVTRTINQDASVALAQAASRAGVKNFVFASSCSVYGIADGGPRREGDPTNPLTAYAVSKAGAEQGLAEIDGDMTVTCLRFATACGMSSRLRLDLVLNDFVACALSCGEISVLSDGTPWRPLIDVADMARAMEWAVRRDPANGGQVLVINAGAQQGNYQVGQLARIVAEIVTGTTVAINTHAPADSRSYQVDFSRYAELASDHQPQKTLADSITGLVDGLRRLGFADPQFRNNKLIRLRVLEDHIASGRLSDKLVWRDRTSGNKM